MPGTRSHAPGTAAAPAAPRPDRTGCRAPGTRPRARSPAHARAGGGWHYTAQPQGLSLFLQRVQLLEPPLPAFERFVQLNQIHVVRRQPPQGCFEGAARIVARADLGGDGDAIAVGLEGATQQDFGRAVAVRGGGVEEGDAALEGAADGREAIGFGRGSAPRRAPHRPGPEPQAGSGGQETQRGPDVCPGPRAHLNRSLRSGRWAPAPPSRRSPDDDSWARAPASRRSAYNLLR